MPTPASQAVFLSYASEDAETARRICESLRAAGIEVWFDQSELVGGDTWDRKIRGQLATCALFVPVISAHTQARLEGYFRLEWKLAAQRTHTMADAKPFLLPVVIDATRDAEAHVPEEFRAVQWTRLPGGEIPEKFCARVKALLGSSEMEPGRPRPGERGEGAAAPTNPRTPQAKVGRRVPSLAWIAAAIALGAVGVFLALRPTSKENAGSGPALSLSSGTRLPTTENSATTPRLGPKSIAVLPFDNLSEDKDASAFFADGMHEDVITNLLLIRELRCVPHATALTLRGTKKSHREIADELGVAYLFTGSVRRAEKKIRITGTLLNPRTDEALWTRPYDKELTDVFAIQAELAQAIAAEMKTLISPEAKKLIERPPTENLAAYDSFLKSRDLRRRGVAAFPGVRGPQQKLLQAQESLLQAAVTLDPKFALAWADLAWVHSVTYYGYLSIWRDRTPARRDKAKLAIENAVRFAPDEPEVILNLGYYHQFCERDYARAAMEFERVERLLPNAPGPAVALAQLFRSQGRWLESLAHIQKAAKLDPSDAVANSDLFALLTAGRRFEESAAELRPFVQLFPRVYEFTQARLPFNATGSTREVEQFLAALADGPQLRGMRWRWAQQHGGYVQPIDPADLPPVKNVSTSESWEPEIATAAIRAARGEVGEARSRLEHAPANLRARLELEPSNTSLLCDLACIEALLGHPAEALRAVRAAMEITPTEFDRWQGPQIEENLAFVYAWTGDKENALATYARLLQTPCVSPRLAGMNVHTMRHSLWFFPLRGDPRWEALLNDPKNKAPLF
ncbi:MAG: hypothetical protein RLZZ15_3531 [Verrucomicrobiota bacterium]|jgi:TolB-like protein/Flp pilus assembly protein TadD